MSHTQESLQKQFNLSEEDVKKTLKACGLSLKRKSYKETEIDFKFAKLRRYFDENLVQNYSDAAKLFQEETSLKRETYSEQAVEELVDAISQLSSDDAEKILSRLAAKGKAKAAQLEQTYEVLLMQKLREKMSNGSLLQKFREEMGKLEEADEFDLMEVVEERMLLKIEQTPSTLSLPGS